MWGTVTKVNESTLRFACDEFERWAEVTRRDWSAERLGSYHVRFSDGRQVGGEWYFPALYRYCAEWVMKGR